MVEAQTIPVTRHRSISNRHVILAGSVVEDGDCGHPHEVGSAPASSVDGRHPLRTHRPDSARAGNERARAGNELLPACGYLPHGNSPAHGRVPRIHSTVSTARVGWHWADDARPSWRPSRLS